MISRLGAVRPRSFGVLALITLAGAVSLFLVWPLPQVERIAEPVLDTRFMASGSDAAAYLDALGPEGRRLYTFFAVGDLLWAIVHGSTVAIGIAVGVRRSTLDDRLVGLAAFGLAYLVLDVAENSSVLAALGAHPGEPPVPSIVLDLVTSAKFLALAGAYVALVVALVAWARARRTASSEGARGPDRS